jgi:mono/diheme cytochrome c family protein
LATGLGALTLVIDLALSPDRQKLALAVAGNGPAQGPTLFEESVEAATSSALPACSRGLNDLGQAPPPGQVIAVSYSPAGVLFAQTREPAAIWRSDSDTTIELASDPRADTGHFLFHANSGGGLACASCHPEGGEDGRVWNFVCLGPRRTQSMRGGIQATAPYHWDGSEVDFSALVDDVFSGRMAGPGLTAEQKMALEAWVDTIPAMPRASAFDASALARGKNLFEGATAACGTCHGGTLLTNNATVDVGTGAAFQVPSLRGVSWRAPFMHTGCAATLTDRFTAAACGGGDKHGMTSGLTGTALGDLVVYLQSL